MISVLITRLKSNKLFYILLSFLLLSIVGCTNPFDKEEKPKKEKVLIYVVDQNQSPVQNLQVGLSETGDSPDIGTILDQTDEDGKTEATLKAGVTYDIYFVIDDDTTQYEKITASENVKDKEFTFILEN